MSLAHQIKPNGIAHQAMAAAGLDGIPVASIRLDGGTQSRAMLQDSVIEEYAYAVLEGVQFPPVVIFYDGADHWLADGFHRVRAYLTAGVDHIPADVRQGTRRDAILYSVGANEAHGLRRTNDDKRRAVLTLLNDVEWAAWSDREIARQCAVGYTLVAKLRPEVTARAGSERTYTTKHGTVAKMNTSAIGKPSKEKDDDMEVVEVADTVSSKRVSLAEGMSFDRMAREGMAREDRGEAASDIAKSFGIGVHNYRKVCDVIFFKDRGGYSEADQAIIDEAYRMLVEDRHIPEAREAIDPIVTKVWGDKHLAVRRGDREPARVERFEHAFTISMQTCATAAELDVPYLSSDDAKKAVKEIRKARQNLQELLSRIERIHE